MDIIDTKLASRFPLIKIVPCGDDSYLVFDSRAGMFYSLTASQLKNILSFSEGKDFSDEISKLYGYMTRLGMFKPGPWTSIFNSTKENIDKLVRHDAENILMRKFVIEVTQDCNFRCSYCSNTLETKWRHHAHRNITVENVRKSIDYYFKLYINFLKKVPEDCREKFIEFYEPSIGFYGGEPTLNWDAVTAGVEYFSHLPWAEYGISPQLITMTVNTNLSKMNSEMIRFLASHNILLFASLDGPASEHDKNRRDIGGHPTFDRAYRNLMKIKDAEPEYFERKVTVFAVQAPNHDWKLNHGFLDTLGCIVSYLDMAPFGCFVDNAKEKCELLEKNIDEYVRQAIERYDANPEKELANYTMFANINVDKSLQRNIANMLPTCPVGTDNLMVDVDGKFHICHKTDGSFVIGNLENGLDTDAVSCFYDTLAHQTDTSACRSCWILPFCGQCPAVRLHGGNFTNPTDDECAYFRKLLEIDLKAFAGIYARHPDIMERLYDFVNDIEKYQGVMDISKARWERFRK